jgi:hypothetical protein
VFRLPPQRVIRFFLIAQKPSFSLGFLAFELRSHRASSRFVPVLGADPRRGGFGSFSPRKVLRVSRGTIVRVTHRHRHVAVLAHLHHCDDCPALMPR